MVGLEKPQVHKCDHSSIVLWECSMCLSLAVVSSTYRNFIDRVLEISLASNICELKFLIVIKSLLILKKLTSSRI